MNARPSTARAIGRIVAVGNLKGGTGKSTIAVNTACRLASEGHAVLLLDADPQGTSQAWLATDEAEALPGGLAVEAAIWEDSPADWAMAVLRRAETVDRLVLDLPPQPGPGFAAALGIIDALLVPVTPSAIDLRATVLTLKEVERARAARQGRPACLLVPNRVDQRTAVGRTVQRSLADLGFAVTPPIAQRSSHVAAFAARTWIGAHASGSAASREMAAVVAALERCLAVCPENECPGATELLLNQPLLPVTPVTGEGQRQGGLGLLAGLLQSLGLRRGQPIA